MSHLAEHGLRLCVLALDFEAAGQAVDAADGVDMLSAQQTRVGFERLAGEIAKDYITCKAIRWTGR